jgi:uncharacterized protein (DUF2147 family)
LQDPFEKDGSDALDTKNPDPRSRTRKILGMQMLNGFVQDKDRPNVWNNGEIYDPDSGKTYSCRLTLENTRRLRVRGYVGLTILGVTQIWSRVE